MKMKNLTFYSEVVFTQAENKPEINMRNTYNTNIYGMNSFFCLNTTQSQTSWN